MMSMKTDKEVVDAFVAHLAQCGHPGLTVDERPDETNRTTQDVDAIAGPFAIEHTSVNALEERRRRDDKWQKAVGGLELELMGSVSAHLSIATKYRAVATGQDWTAIRSALRNWICESSEQMAVGRQEIAIDGVPFPVTVWKRIDLSAGVFFSRVVADSDDTLAASAGTLIERKAKKLAVYQLRGKTTVLLLESDDIAMMNHVKMHEVISAAFPGAWPDGVDQIWYADTTLWPVPRFIDMKAIARECEDK